MNVLSRILIGFVMLTLMVAALPQRAEAYVDPGSGTLMWQALVAAGLGSLFYVRKLWHWVARVMAKAEKEQPRQGS